MRRARSSAACFSPACRSATRRARAYSRGRCTCRATGFAGSLPLAVAGAFFAATGQSSAVVLLNSAAQEEVPDGVLGRVVGVISLTHRGAHATGLLLVSPLFAVVAARTVFGAAAIAVPFVGLGALAVATRRGAATPGRASGRTLRS